MVADIYQSCDGKWVLLWRTDKMPRFASWCFDSEYAAFTALKDLHGPNSGMKRMVIESDLI